VTKGRTKAHDFLEALNDPLESKSHVEKSYSESTLPQQFILDEPGYTDSHTFNYVRKAIKE